MLFYNPCVITELNLFGLTLFVFQKIVKPMQKGVAQNLASVTRTMQKIGKQIFRKRLLIAQICDLWHFGI